ncbi:hypothetical protein ACJH6H_26555 [Mycobacterium sp. SMC-21]|uniref:hypothetical protein n=1 Tax=Mycobacterium sp. SMC-21 TaxID=3381632 RepID=UPI00387682DB
MDSSYAKLARAKTHLGTLDTQIKAFRKRDTHSWTFTSKDHLFQPELGVITVKLKVKEQTPAEWGLIVGDILTNLRAALDHAVVGHAAKLHTLTEAEERKLNFPILLNKDQWLGSPAVQQTATTPAKPKVDSVQKKLVNYVDSAVLAAIETCQPYHFATPHDHPLAGLNDLVNRDKHREIQVVSYVTKALDVTKSDVEVVRTDITDAPMVDGATAAVLTVRRPLAKPGQKVHKWVPANFHMTTEYGERIMLPSLGVDNDVRGTMGVLVNGVQTTLDELKAAGC